MMAQIAIVDDHPIFLDGMAQFLSSHGHDVIFCARSVSEAIARLKADQPDLLILDVSMKDGGGLAILSAIRESGSTVPVIFMTVHIRPDQTLEAIKLGVDGVVLKDSDPKELLTCITEVLDGNKSISPTVMEQALVHSISAPSNENNSLAALTDRELEIAGLIRAGLRNREIAARCGLTEGTVKVHLHSIFQKLGIKSRSELIIMMLSMDNDIPAVGLH
ncbi:response regulator transcription factor [Sphingomonadales bacterium 56]|jgi:DNA-binding NarL/FixJ family response regulator|uniref:Response regulator transcription factor n=2 Tax=Sphingomonadaceae TaxID=41297 RepID=A0ABT0DY10_9SPHN|nr:MULTISPECIES: response regulator transcription factor [Sphingobium]MBY2927202.1 response regulator transcription factor [Sphingomonadales bacterium 56]MBY2957270.1 response regulator transcription factor [Sphingomonadales bacterium 58]MCK0532015.1 response regulator transcription factor [Sphingobium agri]CAD7334711.1 DNA-binding transcriptional activator DevR/DosR [Sphingobium sp. S8]CAD7334730.1 DNA-binding transcriptional activator DevR/DosR [Sphingobium sp. S6]